MCSVAGSDGGHAASDGSTSSESCRPRPLIDDQLALLGVGRAAEKDAYRSASPERLVSSSFTGTALDTTNSNAAIEAPDRRPRYGSPSGSTTCHAHASVRSDSDAAVNA